MDNGNVTAVEKCDQGRLLWGSNVLIKTQLKRKRQEHPGCVQRSARKASEAKMKRLRAWQVRSRRWGGCILATHIQGRARLQSTAWGSGMQVAMAAFGQERWQYVGIAGSQFNSYASILPPLQFQVTGATPRLFGVLLFQNLPFHLREAKHTC